MNTVLVMALLGPHTLVHLSVFSPTLYRLPGFKLSVNALLASLGPHTLGHLSVFSTLYRLPGFKLGVNALLTSLGPHTLVHLSVFFPLPLQTAWFQAECERLAGFVDHERYRCHHGPPTPIHRHRPGCHGW